MQQGQTIFIYLGNQVGGDLVSLARRQRTTVVLTHFQKCAQLIHEHWKPKM